MTDMNWMDASKISVKIFADGADIDGIKELATNPLIKGFTTNPTLMRKAGIEDYVAFSKNVLSVLDDRPLSLEVFADDLDEMAAQAREIASWGDNVYVKIPVINTKGESVAPIVSELSSAGVKLNLTAIMTLDQCRILANALNPNTPAILSVFAGRIADTGRDPMPMMKTAVTEFAKSHPRLEMLWASPRELLNILHAEQTGCQIITVSHDVLKKLSLLGKDLDCYSLETVHMFRRDAVAAGYTIATT